MARIISGVVFDVKALLKTDGLVDRDKVDEWPSAWDMFSAVSNSGYEVAVVSKFVHSVNSKISEKSFLKKAKLLLRG